MGLFEFVKDAGARIFGIGETTAAKEQREAEKARALEKQVATIGLQVEQLRIEFKDELATVHGRTPSHSEREKIILVVGNTQGVAQVDDRLVVVLPPAKAQEPPEPPARFYTVVPGDTLSKIAKQHYGNAMKYPVIFEANKPMLKDPDKIYPGQVLRIPPLT